MIDETAKIGEFARLLVFAENRNEGDCESSLGKDATEEIGQLESDEEGIGCLAGPEEPGKYQVAQESQHPGKSCESADFRQCPAQHALLIVPRKPVVYRVTSFSRKKDCRCGVMHSCS